MSPTSWYKRESNLFVEIFFHGYWGSLLELNTSEIDYFKDESRCVRRPRDVSRPVAVFMYSK